MSQPFRIAVVGGGIGGLSVAISLRKDEREIIILEQSSFHREIGATISLQPNASKIVEQKWGLSDLLQEKGSMVDEAFQIYNRKGELEINVPLLTKEKYGSERLVFHRMDLHDVLKQRATSTEYSGRPAQVRLSSRVKSCDCNRGELTLEDGTTLVADLIVGADGIRSVIRDAVLGKEVSAQPTGHSAYRMMIPTEQLMKAKDFVEIIDPRKSVTTMILDHDRRMIMGPARNSTIYSIVAMVPDEQMNETSARSSWTTPGNLDKMLQTFESFPEWAKRPLELAREAGLWQLRDLDPLETWYKGRAFLVGDAAHAMLPTQGQGASQAIEDAEALGAFFASVENGNISLNEIEKINKTVFDCRYDRATMIQGYSRQSAKPATDPGSVTIKIKPQDFMDYNCRYNGALDWLEKQKENKVSSEKSLHSAFEALGLKDREVAGPELTTKG